MKICVWFWIVEPVRFKVTDEALLAETALYGPYSYRFIHCSKSICFRYLFAHTLGNIWHLAFIYQNTTIICLQEYFFLLIIISLKSVFYFHVIINKTMNKTSSFVFIDTYLVTFHINVIPLSLAYKSRRLRKAYRIVLRYCRRHSLSSSILSDNISSDTTKQTEPKFHL